MLQSGIDLPYPAIRRLISESIDLVIHLERRRGIRSVSELILDYFAPLQAWLQAQNKGQPIGW